ncbi:MULTISPECIES: translation initiation factor IF-2 [unclassified Methylophaga]|jgi:translation initiation factor IF-2|uniref:translation initiation factor IF-2 n=3 Tax=Methylophaga TaxID=40222 RepID=UPI000C90B42C|nr:MULTISPECIES: translation initiation factor IF-2 [unclassified Methylophaga]MAY18235.1 translation initiation factor IF-2 [Methylophaga sp.]MBN47579.1 translation initiation factor IF-2 [Methylophaga sp.]HCD04636.1 translation initiation factor IF-2 [Methylophaga sp.]|tara:strand:- start:19729 stop:22524 length:2796 start_codon:yes stop_codon:yes gene_type:complete
MSDMKVKDLADTVGITPERLVDQLNEAGIKVSKPDDLITEDQKQSLLQFLQQRHGKVANDKDASPKKITLKRKSVSEIKLGGGTSRQAGKSVSVEVRKKRTFVKRSEVETNTPAEEPVPVATQAQANAEEVARQEQLRLQEIARKQQEQSSRQQEESEREAAAVAAAIEAERLAVEEARLAAEEEQKALAEEAKVKEQKQSQTVKKAPAKPELTASQLAHKKLEEADAKRRAANLARIDAEKALEARKKAREEEEALEKAKEEARLAAAEAQAKEQKPDRKEADAKHVASKDKPARRGRFQRDDEFERKELHVSEGKGRRKKKKGVSQKTTTVETSTEHGFSRPTAPVVREVSVPDTISVSDLAQRMSVKAAEVIKALMGMGTMATINQVLDQDTAVILVEEMGHVAKPVQENEVEQALEASIEVTGEALPRAPVVTVMGHVDHGKTSLLDYIRRTKVTSGEAGGITQHIGAYKVETSRGEVTFLDTPGHAAFTEMRSRGAKVTDIVVLVVAADDGVMPQTIEAVQHAKAAGSTLIVAVNKMDKPDATPDRVKQELTNHEVVPEDWGGDVQFVPVSALTGMGVDDLLDAISLQAEVMELTAPVKGPAHGTVVESRLDKGRGTVVTVLVQRGTLRKGDIVVVGQEFGRVRALFNENGQQMDEAGPSTPVELLGLSGTPASGDELQVAPDDRTAREIASFRQTKARELKMAQQQAAKLDDMFNKMEAGDLKTLNVVIKGDVHGSVEAVSQGLQKLSTDMVQVRVVGSGVGGINETDAQLAAASDAILIGFNVRADNTARKVIAEKGLDVQYFSIIYDLLDVVTKAMTGMLEPVYKDEIIGLARVDDVFSSPKFGDIAGCLVLEGSVKRNNPIRVLRDNVVIYEGELESLRRFKDDVNEVNAGTECGIGVKNYKDVKPGDQIEVFERVLMKPSL